MPGSDDPVGRVRPAVLTPGPEALPTMCCTDASLLASPTPRPVEEQLRQREEPRQASLPSSIPTGYIARLIIALTLIENRREETDYEEDCST